MSLQKINKLKDEKGFTIVELLIVIVVIGILAAITIVAFNGVQNRAKAANYQADANGISKVAEAINADAQRYPTATSEFASNTTIKLPANVTIQATPAPVGTDPTEANVKAGAESSPKSYYVRLCTDGTKIFYLDPSKAAGAQVKTIVTGTCV